VKKGYVPPIHDFSIVTLQNEDITDHVINNTGYTVLMISKKLKEAENSHLKKGFELGNYCHTIDINFYILTSSGSDEVKNFENGLTFCNTDETTLKTMIRANPGYVLIKNGTIIGKWSWANLPGLSILLKNNEEI
jgi:triosephosphate isomerase